jgi:hypothetical protein
MSLNAGPRRGASPCGEAPRAFGCGRSSMAEPWAVNPLVPVRLRPVTPKRMRLQCVANSSGRVPGSYPGVSGFEPLATHQHQPPRGGIGRRTGLRNRSPQGMSVQLGPRGPINNSPVAQRQSSALIRRRPVDRAHPGRPAIATRHQPPRRCDMKPIDEDDVCFRGHEQAAQGLPV